MKSETRAEIAFDHVSTTRIIAILRGDLQGRELEIVQALVDGGITAVEVSVVTPGYAQAIQRLSERFRDRAAIGAGTVLTADQLQTVYQAGASFVVSPNVAQEIICKTRELGMASFPGAYTPTEIVLAAQLGAHAVKVFPAVSLGPPYFRALQGPLPDVKLIPTGGIHLGNMADYFAAGAFAVGIGSELVGAPEILNHDTDALVRKAMDFAQLARVIRNVE